MRVECPVDVVDAESNCQFLQKDIRRQNNDFQHQCESRIAHWLLSKDFNSTKFISENMLLKVKDPFGNGS